MEYGTPQAAEWLKSMSMSMSYTLLNKKFSEECEGLCEEMGQVTSCSQKLESAVV